MLHSPVHGPDEQGKRWLEAKVQAILAGGPWQLAPPVSAHQPSLSWGEQETTRQTLFFLLEGEFAPRCLPFPSRSINDCGTHGTHNEQQRATRYIIARLGAMGLM
jgi:hypothetical protein